MLHVHKAYGPQTQQGGDLEWGNVTHKLTRQINHVVTWQVKDAISPLSQDLSIPNLVGYWLFCGYYNSGLHRSKLAHPSIILFLTFFVKENFKIIKF